MFRAVVFINDERVPGPYATAASADAARRQADARRELAAINQLPVPEPATWATLLAGLALLGWRRRLINARGRG